MKMSFLPGELVLEKIDGEFIVTVRGEEVHRGRMEKKAVAAYNKLRQRMETEFPATEWTTEQKRAWLDKMVSDAKVGLKHNSMREVLRKKPAKSRTFG